MVGRISSLGITMEVDTMDHDTKLILDELKFQRELIMTEIEAVLLRHKMSLAYINMATMIALLILIGLVILRLTH